MGEKDTLTSIDLRELLSLLPELYCAADLPAFRKAVFVMLQRLIPADSYAYDEMVPAQGRALCIVSPEESHPASKIPAFTHHLPSHPVISHWQKQGPTAALAISDLVSRSELDRVPVYAEVYREVGVEDQLGLLIDFPKPMMVALACNRGRRTFSQRDKDLLNLLHPHLRRAYENAVLFSQSKSASETLESSPVVSMIRIVMPPRIESISATAHSLLNDFYPGWVRRPRVLPPDLAAWLADQITALRPGSTSAELHPQLLVRRPGRSLIVRLMFDRDRHYILLLQHLSPQAPTLDPAMPPLTPRQHELLSHLLNGLSSKQLAQQMQLSIYTVNDHMKDLYRRLNVSSRGELMARFVRHGP